MAYFNLMSINISSIFLIKCNLCIQGKNSLKLCSRLLVRSIQTKVHFKANAVFNNAERKTFDIFRMENEELKDEILAEGSESFSLERLEMLRVIGTGTFARVCLCQVSSE